MLMLIFPFWSIWIAYRGVRQRFPVSRGAARFWFLIAPAAVFVVVYGVLGMIGASGITGDGTAGSSAN